ncbi:AGAP007101-PA-like protein [Anopheles sinensis]|uniref:AGAP007101-PA-like protein n=1 Tax=Anopheles sinensis TaxID=74873 RepID=A0A084VZ47_ANOSI|nr:AGAP007101-PA-like protein [Anopheles sinensis]
MYYNIEKEICEPELYSSCDYIPHERIIEEYKLQHSLEGSTLAAYPTTVICAINTQITSAIPGNYDTTQPMDVTSTNSVVPELGEQLVTTEPVSDTTMTIPEDPLTEPETIPASKNDISYDEYEETTDANGRSTLLEDSPNTNMVAMSQKSHATEDSVIYLDEFDQENKITHESVAGDEPLSSRYTESQPIENVEESTRPDGIPSQPATEVPLDPELPVDDPSLSAKTRPGYDEMEWDSGAWELPNRSKSKDGTGTGSVTESTGTEWPAHYMEEFPPSNPYSTPDYEADFKSLSQITEFGDVNNSYSTVEPYHQQITTNSEGVEENFNELTDGINSTTSSMRENRDFLGIEQNATDAAEPSNVFDINCNADEDGEIVCNGQRLSVNGYLEILGYRLKLTKWKDVPDGSWNEPGPTINIHLSLQHPFNYLFEAIATEYRTSFSYDYAFTTPPNSTVHKFYEEDTETDE